MLVAAILLSIALIACAAQDGLPLVLLIELGFMSAGILGVQFIREQRWGAGMEKKGVLFGWACAIALVGSMLGIGFELDCGRALLLTWLSAAVIYSASRIRPPSPLRGRWERLALGWIFLGAIYCLVVSYIDNLRGEFHLAVGSLIVALVLSKQSFRAPSWVVQITNTLLLLLIALPMADLFVRARDNTSEFRKATNQYFSYEQATRNPAKYRAWWTYFWDEYAKMGKQIFVRQFSGNLPFRLKPSSSGMLIESRVSINSHGFRGPEISEPKGNAYRIVVIGESTSFGITYAATDKPWPEFLEELIRERLKSARPVQVINAGVPTYDLKQNLGRLVPEIMPLQPDMIISYHGYNGFRFIDSAIPPLPVRAPLLMYKHRPLKILADLEHNLKVRIYRSKFEQSQTAVPPALPDPMKSTYADAYRELIQFARTNHVRLMLGTYSMAVNAQSDPKVIDFYHWTFPMVNLEMRANAAHASIVRNLATEFPEVSLVDTQPVFDGKHQYYIDVAHFTEEGEHKMAETFYAGISNVLMEDLKAR